MKNRKPLSLVIALVICLSTLSVLVGAKPGAAATRIRFKRGESSATVSGMLTSKLLKKTFLIGAKAGQTLYANIEAKTSDGLDFANLIVFDPSGKPIATESTERIHLKQTGDYRAEVTPPGSFYREHVKGYKELRFNLSVRIE